MTVDGEARPKSHRMAAGEVVAMTGQDEDPRHAGDADFEVVFEDEHLLVVDKPAGLVTHPAPGHRGTTLAEALAGRAAGGDDPARAGIVHRLDRDTSGLLLVAKSEAAYEELRRMIAAHEVERALPGAGVRPPRRRQRHHRRPPGPRHGPQVGAVHPDRRSGREAVTHFTVRELLPRTALLDVRLETGRTHQIRAHLAAIGHPVCGDRRYGGAACGSRLGLARQFLHAQLLMFKHPITQGSNAVRVQTTRRAESEQSTRPGGSRLSEGQTRVEGWDRGAAERPPRSFSGVGYPRESHSRTNYPAG